MTEIIGLRFRDTARCCYYLPMGKKFSVGDMVIAETQKGVECGSVVMANHEIDENELVSQVTPIIRAATENDLRTLEENKKREEEAKKIFESKVKTHKLDMNLIDVECTFDNNKMLFYFTADTRVDFRELVKDLASVFRTRIELRQVGVRDEARILGGLGICGRTFCCKGFLSDFQPVSIKMAKEQGLSLNPTKISGTCGRLMCCLQYEQNTYEELLKITPKYGAYVKAPEFRGYVEDFNILTGMLKIKKEKSDDPPVMIHRDEVEILRDGKIRVDRDELKALKGLEDK